MNLKELYKSKNKIQIIGFHCHYLNYNFACSLCKHTEKRDWKEAPHFAMEREDRKY